MPAQRTGGKRLAIHHLIENSEITTCGRVAFDVAFTTDWTKVTCKWCLRQERVGNAYLKTGDR
jgi:hypothetical protein